MSDISQTTRPVDEAHDANERWRQNGGKLKSPAKVHELKTVPPFFASVFHGEKTAELRKHDRPYQIGDHLRLREYLPDALHYTGSEVLAQITDIVTDNDGPWLAEGHCMLSIKILELRP